MKNQTLTGEPDGFEMSEVGSHTEDKYDLVRLYCQLFSTGMKEKWRGKRTYVDLYAGPGKCRIKGKEKILLGSPLIALAVADPFDHYIFCEESAQRSADLSARVKGFANRDVHLSQGNCDDKVEEICKLIPRDNLVLCFVDPYDIGFRFETIKRISMAGYGVDFLFLLAFQMDAARGDNPKHYTNPENTKVDRMLGHSEWRERWNTEQQAGRTEFSKFLAAEFSRSMESIGYLPVPLHKMRQIRTVEKNVPLYYLALYSKNELAYRYWNQVIKYSRPQRTLFD